MNTDFDLEQQRRLLVSLGFGFVETPLELAPAEAPTQRPAPKPAARAAAPAPAPPPPQRPAPAAPPQRRASHATLESLNVAIRGCEGCTLHLVRRQALAGQGGTSPRMLAVVDPPSSGDDAAGSLMSGPVGEMATKLFAAMKLTPDQVFVTGAVKCAPAGAAEATNMQLKSCQPHLHDQIRLLKPEVIVCFGEAALKAVYTLAVPNAATQHNGQWIEGKRIPIMPTLSLRDCVRDAGQKRVLWGHMQLVMARLGLG